MFISAISAILAVSELTRLERSTNFALLTAGIGHRSLSATTPISTRTAITLRSVTLLTHHRAGLCVVALECQAHNFVSGRCWGKPHRQ